MDNNGIMHYHSKDYIDDIIPAPADISKYGNFDERKKELRTTERSEVIDSYYKTKNSALTALAAAVDRGGNFTIMLKEESLNIEGEAQGYWHLVVKSGASPNIYYSKWS